MSHYIKCLRARSVDMRAGRSLRSFKSGCPTGGRLLYSHECVGKSSFNPAPTPTSFRGNAIRTATQQTHTKRNAATPYEATTPTKRQPPKGITYNISMRPAEPQRNVLPRLPASTRDLTWLRKTFMVTSTPLLPAVPATSSYLTPAITCARCTPHSPGCAAAAASRASRARPEGNFAGSVVWRQ